MVKFLLATFLALAAYASAEVTSLTPDNYDSLTSGKTVFIKFFAPWCGHCKAMAGDWEKLADELSSDANVLIAEVDCTAEGDALCSDNGVQGFPTLKYGDPMALEDYEGGRSYDDFLSFSKENLKPSCSPNNIDLCDDAQKALIESIAAMSSEDLVAAIEKVDEELQAVEDEMEEGIEKLQETYEKMLSEAETKKKEAKTSSNYKILKAVFASKKSSGSDEL